MMFQLISKLELESESDVSVYLRLESTTVQWFNVIEPSSSGRWTGYQQNIITVNVSFESAWRNATTARQHSAQESNCYRGKRHQPTTTTKQQQRRRKGEWMEEAIFTAPYLRRRKGLGLGLVTLTIDKTSSSYCTAMSLYGAVNIASSYKNSYLRIWKHQHIWCQMLNK